MNCIRQPCAALRPLRATLFTVAASAALSAQAMSFVFSGGGNVSPVGPPDGDGDMPIAVFDTSCELPGPGTWTLDSNFTFNIFTQTGAGAFTFRMGADSITGTLTTATAPVALGPGFTIDYTVTGGTGTYANMTGGGDSLVRLLGDIQFPPTPYLDVGIMTLAPIPEPGTWATMVAGVLVAGSLAQRRGIAA